MLWLFALVATVVAAVLGSRFLKGRKRRPGDRAPDVVYLHGFPRSDFVPQASSFVLKLETFLRLARIPYTFVGSLEMSKKGKMPWIEYNGEEVADSEFVISFLEQKTAVDLNAHLTASQRAISTAVSRMLDESTYWTIVADRWRLDNLDFIKAKLIPAPFPLSLIIPRFILHQIQQSLHQQGYGRHSREELTQIACRDWDAVSELLGDKPFFFGDEPSRIDSTIFGHLAQPLHNPYASPVADHIRDNLPNLVAYCERMKKRFFADWEELTQSAAKQNKAVQHRVFREFPVVPLSQ